MHFITFLESKSRKFYHGSKRNLPIGTILTPQQEHKAIWGINQWYQILEKYKPFSALDRSHAVFMVANIDDTDLSGGVLDFIYQVEPLGKVEKHDVNWISELEYLTDDSIRNQDKIIEAAKKYWQGAPHYDEQVWEYLTPSAKILKLVETN